MEAEAEEEAEAEAEADMTEGGNSERETPGRGVPAAENNQSVAVDDIKKN